jgi:DNA-binding response OmpR family regulator
MDRVVLVAGEDTTQVDAIVQGLEGAGFSCLTARSGDEALAVAARYSPQLVLLPAALPELEGTEVCLRLKQDTETEAMIVILLAEEAADDYAFVAEQVGADDYLVGPLDAKRLVKRVEQALGAEEPKPKPKKRKKKGSGKKKKRSGGSRKA